MKATRETTAAAREWLFKASGQVFGPVPEERLKDLILRGEVDAATEVATQDGRWRPLGALSGFLVHLRKAEARARVEAEVTNSRKLVRRRNLLHSALAALAALSLVGLAGYGAIFLATTRPWEKRSALLADFGDGISLSSVRVGGGLRATEGPEEIAIPQVDAAQPGAGRTRRITGALHPARSSAGADTGLVLARYDPRRIQEVVARRQGSLAPCLREEAHRSPDFSGEIPIEFAVGNDGKVVALWIDEARFKSGPLRECLLAKLRDWSFDRFPGERPIISLAFRIGAR